MLLLYLFLVLQAGDADIGINAQMEYRYIKAPQISSFPGSNASVLSDGRINITVPLQIKDKNVFHFGVGIRNQVPYSRDVSGELVIQKVYLTIEVCGKAFLKVSYQH